MGLRGRKGEVETVLEFFRRPELDAAVIGTTRQGQFCLNPFGKRVQLARTCQLRAIHRNGVADPETEEANGTAFLADFDGDRRNEAAMLERLSKKYRLGRLIPIKPTQYTAMACIAPGGSRDEAT